MKFKKGDYVKVNHPVWNEFYGLVFGYIEDINYDKYGGHHKYWVISDLDSVDYEERWVNETELEKVPEVPICKNLDDVRKEIIEEHLNPEENEKEASKGMQEAIYT